MAHPDREEQLALLLDGLRDAGMLTLDAEGRVTAAHGALLHAASTSAPRALADLYPPEEVEAGLPALDLEHSAREGRLESQ